VLHYLLSRATWFLIFEDISLNTLLMLPTPASGS
jgi:hypothetical protein